MARATRLRVASLQALIIKIMLLLPLFAFCRALSDPQFALHMESTMCKAKEDFDPMAPAAAFKMPVIKGGEAIVLPCGIGYSVEGRLQNTIRDVFKKLQWSDVTCADFTKNIAQHWDRSVHDDLWMKSTLQANLQVYASPMCLRLQNPNPTC